MTALHVGLLSIEGMPFMTFQTLLATLQDPHIMLPLLGSVVAGALIGAEREAQGKPAGLRTHTLVCFASALMTLLALHMAKWTADLPAGTQIVSDMSRMPHAILTGVGFLGAGVIFREGATVQGLTTAASLWMTAALGVAFGSGMLELAGIATALTLAVLILMRFVQRLTKMRPELELTLTVHDGGGFDAARLRAILAQAGLQPGPLAVAQNLAEGTRTYATVAAAYDHHFDIEALSRQIASEASMQSFELSPVVAQPR